MQIGKRQQQGRTDGKRTGTKPREKCPLCGKAYLQSFYGKEGKLKTIGKYCPDKNCSYCRKNVTN